MKSASNRYALIFNGEVHNRLELQKKLSHYSFKGHGDTETIVASLQNGLADFIKSFIDMFAVAA